MTMFSKTDVNDRRITDETVRAHVEAVAGETDYEWVRAENSPESGAIGWATFTGEEFHGFLFNEDLQFFTMASADNDYYRVAVSFVHDFNAGVGTLDRLLREPAETVEDLREVAPIEMGGAISDFDSVEDFVEVV